MCASALLERPLEPLPMWSTGRKPSPSTWNLPTTVLTSHVHVHPCPPLAPVLELILPSHMVLIVSWRAVFRQTSRGWNNSLRPPGITQSLLFHYPAILSNPSVHVHRAWSWLAWTLSAGRPGSTAGPQQDAALEGCSGHTPGDHFRFWGELRSTPPFLLKVWKASTSFHLGSSWNSCAVDSHIL